MNAKEKEVTKRRGLARERNLDRLQESLRPKIDIGKLESPVYVRLSADYNPDEAYGELS